MFAVVVCRLLTLDEPVSYHRADVGRCNTRGLFENITGNGDVKPHPGIPSFTVTVKRPEEPTTTPEPTTEKPVRVLVPEPIPPPNPSQPPTFFTILLVEA